VRRTGAVVRARRLAAFNARPAGLAFTRVGRHANFATVVTCTSRIRKLLARAVSGTVRRAQIRALTLVAPKSVAAQTLTRETNAVGLAASAVALRDGAVGTFPAVPTCARAFVDVARAVSRTFVRTRFLTAVYALPARITLAGSSERLRGVLHRIAVTRCLARRTDDALSVSGTRVDAERLFAVVSNETGLALTRTLFVTQAVSRALNASRVARWNARTRGCGVLRGTFGGRLVHVTRGSDPLFDTDTLAVRRARSVTGALALCRGRTQLDGAIVPIPAVVAPTLALETLAMMVALPLADCELACGTAETSLADAMPAEIVIRIASSVAVARIADVASFADGVETVVAAPSVVTLAESRILIASSMIAAVPVARSFSARGSAESGLTDTCAVTTKSIHRTNGIASTSGAGFALKVFVTLANTVQAFSITVTVVRAVRGFASETGKSLFATTHTLRTVSASVAVVLTCRRRAGGTQKSGLANALSHDADSVHARSPCTIDLGAIIARIPVIAVTLSAFTRTVTRAIVWASSNRAVLAAVTFVAGTRSVLTHSVRGAIILTYERAAGGSNVSEGAGTACFLAHTVSAALFSVGASLTNVGLAPVSFESWIAFTFERAIVLRDAVPIVRALIRALGHVHGNGAVFVFPSVIAHARAVLTSAVPGTIRFARTRMARTH